MIAQQVVGYRLEEDDDDIEFVALVASKRASPAGGASKPWWKLW